MHSNCCPVLGDTNPARNLLFFSVHWCTITITDISTYFKELVFVNLQQRETGSVGNRPVKSW